jgi:hypothetical protein
VPNGLLIGLACSRHEEELVSGQAGRLSVVRSFQAYLRAFLAETDPVDTPRTFFRFHL